MHTIGQHFCLQKLGMTRTMDTQKTVNGIPKIALLGLYEPAEENKPANLPAYFPRRLSPPTLPCAASQAKDGEIDTSTLSLQHMRTQGVLVRTKEGIHS